MDKDLRSMARQFGVYDQLGWYARWKFRRHLAWIVQDTVSLNNLLEFEKGLEERTFPFLRITNILQNALAWYHREDVDERLPNRLPGEKLPDMFEVVLRFYSKSGRLHRSYRGLLLRILQAEEEIKNHRDTGRGISPVQFRYEATDAVSNLSKDWGEWNAAYLNHGAEQVLGSLTKIARNVSNAEMFRLFQIEAAKVISSHGLWYAGEKLHPLEAIACKVDDKQTFTVVFRDIVPVIGLETTSALISITKDFQEFQIYYQKIKEQLALWKPDFISVFTRAKSSAELDRLLHFLGTLAKQERLSRYIHYPQVPDVGILHKYIADAFLVYPHQVMSTCLTHDWEREPDYQRLIDAQADQFEIHILDSYLSDIWYSRLGPDRILWEFSQFTEYIPYEIGSWDWTKDTDQTRRYWNYRDAEQAERQRTMGVLRSLLLPIFQALPLPEAGTLLRLLPETFGIQGFTKRVKVPVEWEKGTEYEEAYDKWAGNYTRAIEVARPTRYVEHEFAFERPYLNDTIDLLTHMDRVYEAIRAYQKSRS